MVRYNWHKTESDLLPFLKFLACFLVLYNTVPSNFLIRYCFCPHSSSFHTQIHTSSLISLVGFHTIRCRIIEIDGLKCSMADAASRFTARRQESYTRNLGSGTIHSWDSREIDNPNIGRFANPD